ncbi:hypothetical protein JYK14_06915 [Siccirubricoccus sp. KC 17139]|uniref:EAL domain-containing protein n=1 Tax=Siccirubricoccus soli TaxID=2899147 RepID=A0ABT1D2S3_9PROT|nr:hypothetical protein [Siccirubricoccus soli]MCO6415907.1 hypothetical protein [Siccirubricoccus soli]MCP2682039.1 hypothetical protein [Siccirubricoccus soli]
MIPRAPDLPGTLPHALSTLGRNGAGDALALAQLLRGVVAAGVVRRALHLRLSDLGPDWNQPHHRRLVREALEPLLASSRAQLFELPQGDLVVVAPPFTRHLAAVEQALATMFAADAAEAEPPAGTPPFAVLRLPEEAAALLAAAEAGFGASPAVAPAPGEGEGAVTTADLAALELGLGHASLARFLRRRPVCRLVADGEGAEMLWEEWRPALGELSGALLGGADPTASPWLFRRLRRLLDRRLLVELARPEEVRRRGPCGLSLALETIGSPEFLRLDGMLGSTGRAGVVLALAAADALADPEGFRFATGFCRARGYRVALEVAELAALPLLPLDRLGIGLLRLRWSPGLPLEAQRLPGGLAAWLPKGRGAVVLAGADRAAAIGWGWEEGIALFEGRLVRPRS